LRIQLQSLISTYKKEVGNKSKKPLELRINKTCPSKEKVGGESGNLAF
jgi:hypothetical protein